uniref:C-type lectin domain-containing protein n=1 Tax=Ditylenchus dipsaci TaxID=166011 RepID=A0A915ECG3_9BILA
MTHSLYTTCQNFNGSCFFFPYVKHNPIRNQSSARDVCLQNGGDLPSIHSKQENDFLKGILLPVLSHWLGMVIEFENTKINSTVAKVKWTDNSLLDYANPMGQGFRFGSEPWIDVEEGAEVTDEPNNYLQKKTPFSYCTNMLLDPRIEGGWQSNDCSYSFRVICKKPAV